MNGANMTDDELKAEIASIPYWYHKIELRPGITTPGWAPINKDLYRIPDDLTGKRVLDVGAWDGFWTIEALRRGAREIDAIENFSDTIGGNVNADRFNRWNSFDLAMRGIGFDNPMSIGEIQPSMFGNGRQRVVRYECDVQKMEFMAVFNTIFCFGVLYHLQHPFLALQNMRSMCKGTIHIETAILDGCQSGYNNKGYDSDDVCMEFYPTNEYGKNPSNWWVGTLKCWVKMVEAAGFKNVESWKLTDEPQSVAECRGFIRAEV